jgi:hypothetical protein
VEQDRQYWTGRTGQAELNKQNWTGRTGQAEQGRQDRVAGIRRRGQPGKDRKAEDGRKGTDRTGQAELDCRDRTSGQGGPDRSTGIGLPAQDCKEKTPRAEQKGEHNQKRAEQIRTARAGLPEWDRQDSTSRPGLPGQG